jgi:hypothetical protein
MKKLNRNELHIGQLVVCTEYREAQVRTIAKIDRFNVLLASFEGDNLCTWWADYTLCHKPTIEQVEYTVNNWGRIVSLADLKQIKETA